MKYDIFMTYDTLQDFLNKYLLMSNVDSVGPLFVAY